LRGYSSVKEAVILEGADHIFGVLEEDQTMANTVIDTSVQWFKDKL
jgi:hypothetical protein